MEFSEDSPMLSLFSDEASLWGQLPDEGGIHLGPGLDSHLNLKEGKLATTGFDSLPDPLSPESDVSGDDPLPDWMSQKVSLSAWLGDEEDIPMADLMTIPPSPAPKMTMTTSSQAEELLKELLVDIGVPPTPSSDWEDQSAEDLLALSPDLSPVLSPALSPGADSMPSSPLSQASIESYLQPMTQPASPATADLGLEAQALALLDAMGCMEFTLADQGVASDTNAQVITVMLPQPDEPIVVNQQAPASPESIQSSAPQSPQGSSLPSPTPSTRRTKSKPKLKNASPIDRKVRKRDQNKEAATRYRVKKRVETEAITGELNGLQKTNKALKDKVEGLSKEIKYLKDLLIEVRLLKGQIDTVQT